MFPRIENAYDPNTDFNQLPSRREMAKSALYWNLTAPLLGIRGGHHERENQRIVALRKNAEAYAAQRRPSVIAEIVAEVVDKVAQLLPAPVVKAASALEAASDWLLEQLASGPKAATSLATAATEAGIAGRTLERARKVIGLKPRRIGSRSFWMLPEHESANK